MSPTNLDPRLVAEKRVGQWLCNKWRLDRLLDIGGMAAVYVATHRNGKRVAVKMLHPAFAEEPNICERFLREGYVANKVNHPGAVSILDDEKAEDGTAFIVMELLEGTTLEAWLDRAGGKLSVDTVMVVADQILQVLAAAHPKGIVHRDIKPANLFITLTGKVKVLDFGLARLRDANMVTKPTAMGIVIGTTSYMSPEQATGKSDRIDGRTDIFALGAVMFRALTGRLLHAGTTPAERLIAAMERRAPRLLTIDPLLPDEVCDVVDRALQFEMQHRYADALLMLSDLRRASSVRRGRRSIASMHAVSAVPLTDLPSVVPDPIDMTVAVELEVPEVSAVLEDDGVKL
ncbi:MAG: serine/threonine-protein kinase [Myxococcales bacterium]